MDEVKRYTNQGISKTEFKNGIKAPVLPNNTTVESYEYIQDDRLDIFKRI